MKRDVTGIEEDAGSESLAIDHDEKGETEEEPKPTEEASPKEKQPTPVLFQLNNPILKRLRDVTELQKVLKNTPKATLWVKPPVN